MTMSHGGRVDRAAPTAPAPTGLPLPLPSPACRRGCTAGGHGPPSQAVLTPERVPPPRPGASSRCVSSLLLTHLRLDALGLPDVSDGFQEATLSFRLCHYQTCQFISQVFQATPEPTGLLTALARKDMGVRSPGHLGERLVEAGGPGGEEHHRLQMPSVGGFTAALRAGQKHPLCQMARPARRMAWAHRCTALTDHNTGWCPGSPASWSLSFQENTETILITQYP